MIFRPHLIEQIRTGAKTQTRRPVKAGEEGEFTRTTEAPRELLAVHQHRRVKWSVGRTYAIQPKRGLPAIGRFRLVGLRHEPVADISDADAKAEGFANRAEFFDTWREFYGNIEGDCWVLEFGDVVWHDADGE